MGALRTLTLFGLLGAAAWAYVGSAAASFRDCQPARQVDAWARAWRIGGLPWRDLAVFAEVIQETLPAGSVVAFRAIPAEHAVAWRIAYLLPRYEVWPVSVDTEISRADYAAVFRGDWQRPELRLVLGHRLGSLYRVERTGPRAVAAP